MDIVLIVKILLIPVLGYNLYCLIKLGRAWKKFNDEYFKKGGF